MKRSELREEYPKAFEKMDALFEELDAGLLTPEERKTKIGEIADIVFPLSIIRITAEGMSILLVAASRNYTVSKKFERVWPILRLPIVRHIYCFFLSRYSLYKAQKKSEYKLPKEDRNLFKSGTYKTVKELMYGTLGEDEQND